MREKEIFAAAEKWANARLLSSNTECQRAFISGAEWAERTERTERKMNNETLRHCIEFAVGMVIGFVVMFLIMIL